MILPLVLHYLCPACISIAGLGAIAAATMSSADSALLSAGSMFAYNIYRKILRKKAAEIEVLWAMRTSMLVFGAGAASLAFYSSSVHDLWFLSGELVHALLFPQFRCALFTPSTKTYGLAAGSLVGLLLRLLTGEPALSIPPVICYPVCSLVNGIYSQVFPFKTFTMLLTFSMILAVSYSAKVLFQRIFTSFPTGGMFAISQGEPHPHPPAADGETEGFTNHCTRREPWLNVGLHLKGHCAFSS
ncbi:high affinity choline transporter 1-like isoform X2 [Neopelma chrysocephalum]|uniref:high affinity choline transporter 1-like isoform X2 n=1 Tax=Neopelma chrysocephalum TaxID=114329 RepID=UPI000FCD3617|nr:high affinity choline transporter 1-like isoform X2 [Neopelma chrysocephalum]